MSIALQPLVDGFPAQDLRLSGPAGTGKTTLAKYLLTQLEQTLPSLQWGYVNCVNDSGRHDLLHSLLDDLGGAPDLRRQTTGTGFYFERLRNADGPVVAIVDEVSVIQDPKILCGLYDTSGLTVVTITVDQDRFLSKLDYGPLESRFRAARPVRLAPYSHAELRDIVSQRVVMGLRAGVITSDALDRIAELAEGDARFGIGLLRSSVSEFPSTDDNQITAALVESVAEETRVALRERYLSQLNEHQRLLYEIIAEAGEIGASELHERYEQRSEDPRTKSMRRRYLTGLADYQLIESTGSGRATTYKLRQY